MALSIARGWDPAVFTQSPWLWPYRVVSEPLVKSPDWPEFSLLENVIEARAKRVAVPPLKLRLEGPKKKKRRRKEPTPITSLYDLRIAELNELNTRAHNWHDFFNVLAFATWPRAKRALHARQARLLRARLPERITRLPGARTREQDALTMFDEGGVVLAALEPAHLTLIDPDVNLDSALPSLCEREQVRIAPFGHALAEHIVAGLPCPLAYAFTVILPSLDLDAGTLVDTLDDALANALADDARFLAPSGVKGLSLERLSASIRWL